MNNSAVLVKYILKDNWYEQYNKGINSTSLL